MSLVAFKHDMQYAFLFTNFVWSSYGSPWLQLSAQGKLGVISQQACSAFSHVTFGRNHAQQDIEFDGIAQYGQAVSKVRAGLGSPTNSSFADLLVPILIFLLYSSSMPNMAESHSHVMGLSNLLHMAGPEAFQQHPLRDAFSSCRGTLVTVGLLQKRRLFLEDDRWRDVPWALRPESKSNQDQLVDFLVKLPGFLEDQQTLRTTYDAAAKQSLVDEVLSQLQLLFQWRWNWETNHPSAAREEHRPDVHVNSTTAPPRVVERILVFSSFAFAVVIALYDAVLLCLLGLLYTELDASDAREHIQRVSLNAQWEFSIGSDSSLTLPHFGTISLIATAIEIARIFEYELLHVRECGNSAALFWLFPLGLAGKVLQNNAPMTRWIQTLLDTSEVTRGYGRGDNAFGFGFYELPKVYEQSDD